MLSIKNNSGNKSSKAMTIPIFMLTILRIAIGWHFLYEGISKFFNPNWSSAGYLIISKWIFSGFYHWIASTPSVLKIVDFLNVWGLILVGLGLLFGCFTRIASIAGAVLILLYYLANPPFVGMDFGVITEGNYLIVDKNFIELLILVVLTLFPTGTLFGLDRLILQLKVSKRKSVLSDRKTKNSKEKSISFGNINRREVLKNLVSLPVLGAFVFAVLKKRGWDSYEEKILKNVDAVTSATIKTFDFSSLNDLKGQVPHGQVAGVDFRRVILGGNLIGG